MTKKLHLTTRKGSHDFYLDGSWGLCKIFVRDYFPDVNLDKSIVVTLSNKKIKSAVKVYIIYTKFEQLYWYMTEGDDRAVIYYPMEQELLSLIKQEDESVTPIWVRITNE